MGLKLSALLLLLAAPLLPDAPLMSDSRLPAPEELAADAGEDTSAFRLALSSAERALENGQFEKARELIERALERDRRSTDAWALRARWGLATDNRDEQIYSLHKRYGLAVAQKLPRKELRALQAEILELDPIAKDLLGMREHFLDKLESIASKYEKDGRPHGAIRVYKQILALDPEYAPAQEAIDRIAAVPDPSLAGDAKPKDLFADVTDEWISEFNAQHATWDERALEERENYKVYTDAGYEVLIQTAEAMEQMNVFYRQFFRFATDEYDGFVPQIGVNIFKNREEYLELGIGPPIEWSGGHFTGAFVETYIGSGGFNQMMGTLFHEAAHQFVSLATRAVGWLNEGLASFFEGTRILPNGTVIMNMPANGRLFPLASRMEKGWMSGPNDGIDAGDANTTPEKAPTFRIVLENGYSWGPPWYAPTWGVVYFLYNYQDPVDGRFVYRDAFSIFIDKSSMRRGEGAVTVFEETVLANPKPPYEGVERPDDAPELNLPTNVDDLDPVWKDYIINLREEQQGSSSTQKPYGQWGLYAAEAGELETALDHYEKGLVAEPDNIELLMAFAELLEDEFSNKDRAAKLVLEAIYFMENSAEPDEKRIEKAERLLSKLDPKRRTLARVIADMGTTAKAIVQRYESAGLDMMVMDVSWRLGRDLELSELFETYEATLRRTGKSLQIWDLAYNEKNLNGWNAPGTDASFRANGTFLEAEFGKFDEDLFDFQIMTMDVIASGDFSMDADVQATKGKVNFGGFVFGQKGPSSFHSMVLFPGKTIAEGAIAQGFVDLLSSYGSGQMKTWRHMSVLMGEAVAEGQTSTGGAWHKLRLDVSGRFVDMWFDGQLLASHEFPSRDAVRGGFGIICGPGAMRMRNVRYLARDPRDPASQVEREIRLESLERDESGAVNGSYLGQNPPWPEVGRWLQGERRSWHEKRGNPQLLVVFSIQQNEMVPIDEWLTDLAKRTRAYGLEIVSICSPNDEDKIAEYLQEHPMPGAVGVDLRKEGEFGIGRSFETFFIRRFGMPRLVLIDMDGKVTWEGDPGFEIGAPYDPTLEAFIETPLQDLFARYKLKEVAIWRAKWKGRGAPALAQGNLPEALELLQQAAEFTKGYWDDVDLAQARLAALQGSLDALEMSAASFSRDAVDPAFDVLLQWAPLFEIEIDKKTLKSLAKKLDKGVVGDWENALREVGRFANKKGASAEKAPGTLAKLAKLEGRFAIELTAELTAASAAGDWDTFERLAAGAGQRPARWLAGEYFGW